MRLRPGQRVRIYNVGGKWTVVCTLSGGLVQLRQHPCGTPVIVSVSRIRRGWGHAKR